MFFSQILTAQSPVTIMTFNLRLNTTSDGENSWPYRKDMVAAQILKKGVDIVGVQEALDDQMTALKQRLKGYAAIGVGRDDGQAGGEYSAIFYNTKKFKLLNGSTFWLSPTPDEAGSVGWDAALPRIVTWGQFEDLNSGSEFFVFNTHFDHIGKIARKESALLLMQKVDEIAEDYPAIITGDFNSVPTDEPIKLLENPSNPLHFTDSRDASETPHSGPEGTFNNFKTTNPQERIDYIFIKNGVKVLNHSTIAETPDSRFSSDHFPVVSQVVVPGTRR